MILVTDKPCYAASNAHTLVYLKVFNMLRRNVGDVGRVLRILVGLGVLSLAFIGPRTLWGYVGIVLIATGLIGWCPAWKMFGFSTCKIK